MKILVTGGLGYIGSHTVVELIQSGHDVVIYDNCSNSTVDVLTGIESITGVNPVHINRDILDLCDTGSISLREDHPDIDAVIHFAAKKSVGESESTPEKYYTNNVVGTLNVLKYIKQCNIKKFVFSSSCTVYGEPETLPVNENTPTKPASSVYGRTKQICEQMICDYVKEHDFGAMLLRYFNPVGAHDSGFIGELPRGTPDNLIPYVTQTAAGIREQLVVHGNDYDTPDGTCVRDYIHVMDLAKAHVSAVTRCEASQVPAVNLGTGRGYSVKEVIDTFELVSGVKLNYIYGPRRPGDLPAIYNDPSYAKQFLNWSTSYNLRQMLADSWSWQQNITII